VILKEIASEEGALMAQEKLSQEKYDTIKF